MTFCTARILSPADHPRRDTLTTPSLAKAAALAAVLAATSGGAAAQTAFAAQTGVSTISPCPSFCGGSGAQFGFDSDGGEGFASSQSALSNIDGQGQAEAVLTGPVNLPILRAEAFAATGRSSRVQATAAGMQGFYVGANGLPAYQLALALSGQATGTVHADVLVFRDLDPTSLPQFTSDMGTMAFEVVALSGDLELLQRLTLTLPADGTAQSASATLDIENVAAGDLFHVWASLGPSGLRGTYGDAFNTFRLSYTDTTGLSQTAPVPEPGAWLMLAAGLSALAWRRRSLQRPAARQGGRQAAAGGSDACPAATSDPASPTAARRWPARPAPQSRPPAPAPRWAPGCRRCRSTAPPAPHPAPGR